MFDAPPEYRRRKPMFEEDAMNGPQAEMPRYKCHKEVHALQILGISPSEPDGSVDLYFEEKQFAPIRVSKEWIAKHLPEDGVLTRGYYVVYDDGYVSWSPEKAFQDGYTKL